MEIRHLEALLVVAEEGSFTAAADRLHTVQSNVSGHVHQLEAELGVQLLVRSRRGTVPTEFGVRVIERARAIRSELDAMHKDLSMLQGLETGHATLGVVGTVSRSLVPALVVEMRRVAPGLSLRLTEGASERLAADVAERAARERGGDRAGDRIRASWSSTSATRISWGSIPVSLALQAREPVLLATLAAHPVILPPQANPLRDEVDDAARAEHVSCGSRSRSKVSASSRISSLSGAGVSILPETAFPTTIRGVRTVRIARMPPRRLALITARGVQLSLGRSGRARRRTHARAELGLTGSV